MTDLQKKAIQHCIDTLNQIDTHEVYKHVRECVPPNQMPIMNALQDANNVHVNKPKNEVIEWLTALIK